jgi:hypothetical protein
MVFHGFHAASNTQLVDVIAIAQRDEDGDVQQRSCHTASSSRSRST